MRISKVLKTPFKSSESSEIINHLLSETSYFIILKKSRIENSSFYCENLDTIKAKNYLKLEFSN